jgi:hypothetical protein
MKKVLSIVFAGLVTVGLANAAITTSLVNVTGSGPYTWNYEISVDSLEELVAGNYFTIYDIGGTLGTVSAPTNWTDSVQLTGITPPTQNPTDSGSIDNITFTYTGPTVEGALSDVTGFSFVDSLGSASETGGQFTYQATKISTGGLDQGIGSVEVPTATPEPVTTGLIGLALVGMAVARRKFAR